MILPGAGADPLVLLPGMGCTAALWSRLDLGSIEVETPVLTEPTLDAEVDRLLEELPTRFVLGGLSLGAIVAMALVRRAPERVSRLVLMSTNPYAPTAAQYAAWTEQRQTLAAGVSARELQQRLLPLLLSADVIAGRPDLVELTLSMADELGVDTLDAQLRMQATRIDERPGLAALGCPTTVLSARGDRLCSVERHQELASLIPGAELTVLADCAHLSPLEQPAAVLAALTGEPAEVRVLTRQR